MLRRARFQHTAGTASKPQCSEPLGASALERPARLCGFLGGMLAATLVLAACARVPDVDAIRSDVEAVAAAAQAQDRGTVLSYVTDDFTGNAGELDREGLDRMLRARSLAGRAIGVSIGGVQVAIDGDRATAHVEVTLTDGSGRWLPEHRATLAMVTGWRREKREWRCYSAQWKDG